MNSATESTLIHTGIPVYKRGTDHGQTSAHNRLMVWEILRQHGPQSRRQLSQLLHMGNSTLTYLVRDLFDLGLLRNKGKRASESVGKKQELLEIDPDYGLFAGCFIEGAEVSVTLIDTAGQELDHQRLHCGRSLDQALDVIAEYLSDVPARIGQTVDALQGVGLGIPGIVDSMTGQIKLCWRLDLKDYDLAKAVGKRWDLPTVIENDVKLAAWAEAEHLAIELPESLLFLALNASDDQQSDALYGLGMSVIHQGKLQTGANNAAGELQNLHSLLGFIEMTHEDLQSLRLPDAPVNPAMDRFAQTVGTMLSLLTDLIDPELIVLGGSLEIHNARILDQIQQRIVTTRVHQADDCLRMCTSTCGERGVCNGAALLARRSVVHEVLAGLEKSNARQPRTSHV